MNETNMLSDPIKTTTSEDVRPKVLAGEGVNSQLEIRPAVDYWRWNEMVRAITEMLRSIDRTSVGKNEVQTINETVDLTPELKVKAQELLSILLDVAKTNITIYLRD